MNEGASNVNRRKFLRQSVSFMAVGAGTLVLPAGLLSLTYMTKAAFSGEQAIAQSPSDSPLPQEAIPLARGLLYPQQNHVRNLLDTSGLWQFQLDPREEGEAQGWFNVLPAPRPIAVPCSWNDLFDDARDYLGVAWYLNEVWIPSGWRGQRVFLRVGSANYAAKVWANGMLAAQHLGGHLPFAAEITSPLVWDRKNVIAIMIENKQMPERVPPGPASGGAGVLGTWPHSRRRRTTSSPTQGYIAPCCSIRSRRIRTSTTSRLSRQLTGAMVSSLSR